MLKSLLAIIALVLSATVSIGIFAIGIFFIVVIVRSFKSAKRSHRSSEKQLAIRTYSKCLGKSLQQRYGVREQYTPAQVKSTIKESGLNTDRDCYGMAMYNDRSDFIEYHRSIGESCDYDAMRSEIRECLSLSDNTFTTSEAISAGDLFTDRGDLMYESTSSSDDGGGGSGWSFWSGGSDGGGSDGGSGGGSDGGGGGGGSDGGGGGGSDGGGGGGSDGGGGGGSDGGGGGGSGD